MLKIMLVSYNQSVGGTLVCQLLYAVDVPRIQLRQVVLAQSVPSLALSAAGNGLLVERSPDVAVLTADTFVVVAAAVIPKTVVLVEERNVLLLKVANHRVDTRCSTLTFHTGNKPRNGIAQLREG